MSGKCEKTPSEEAGLSAAQLRGWAEIGCWIALGISPILYFINGPAVSTDQYIVRMVLVILAACGGVGLRLCVWLRGR
jgi:hypothetical protein